MGKPRKSPEDFKTIAEVRTGLVKLDEYPLAYSVTELTIGRERRKAYVIDKVIEANILKPVYDYFRLLPYRFIGRDRTPKPFGMHMFHSFGSKTRSDKVLTYLVDFSSAFLASQGLKRGKLHRLYSNFVLAGDFHYRHFDGDEWTAMTFMNNEWRQDWGGEFVMYGDNERVPAISILPVPGRMVLFDGLIRHRAGVPSRLCFEPRISVVARFTR